MRKEFDSVQEAFQHLFDRCAAIAGILSAAYLDLAASQRLLLQKAYDAGVIADDDMTDTQLDECWNVAIDNFNEILQSLAECNQHLSPMIIENMRRKHEPPKPPPLRLVRGGGTPPEGSDLE